MRKLKKTMKQFKAKSAVILFAATLIFILMKDGFTGERHELTDAELGRVTAGSASLSPAEDLASFRFVKTTLSGKRVTAKGSFKLIESIDRLAIGKLTLTDSAQSNLRSLININAVNSEVNVLLNLNINIDSNVGSLNQFNIKGAIPGLLNMPVR